VTPVAAVSPSQSAGRVRISLEVAIDLVLCGVLMAGLSFLANHLQPSFPQTAFITGLVGGGLCVLWGVLGRRGSHCRAAAMVTLAAVACVFTRQAVQSWQAPGVVESNGPPVTVLMIVLAAFCVGTLTNLAKEAKSPP
jgi:hypothetical protein